MVAGRQAVALDGLVLLTGLYAAISPGWCTSAPPTRTWPSTT
ncbi:hypothetical protein ACFQZC_06110 [Streptacidiphilus monticola]